ncbi:hypothetical protein [Johnsonella ignava]|uniref:hypothetical protein n=1 Tax=Johnsonella ignava TaxID=43995 RepID=UPI0023F5892E|nr:hypothetical protein [Johnsonella ignava]
MKIFKIFKEKLPVFAKKAVHIAVSAMKWLAKNIPVLVGKIKESTFERVLWKNEYILWILIIAYSIYYFPFVAIVLQRFGLRGINAARIKTLWIDNVYTMIDRYMIVPYISGLLSLFILVSTRRLLLRGTFFVIYCFSIAISLSAMSTMTSLFDGLFYFPHILLIILHVYLSYV